MTCDAEYRNEAGETVFICELQAGHTGLHWAKDGKGDTKTVSKFVIGQRVLVTGDNFCGSVHEGYYGHITRIELPDPVVNRFKEPLCTVFLKGRVGPTGAAPWMLSPTEGFNPYEFFESELEGAD